MDFEIGTSVTITEVSYTTNDLEKYNTLKKKYVLKEADK